MTHPSLNPHELWQSVLVEIELEISPAQFKTWFRGTSIVNIEGGTVTIGVPTEIAREWIQRKHEKLILKALRARNEHIRCVEFVVVKQRPRIPSAPAEPGTLPLTPPLISADGLHPRYTFDMFVVGPFNELAHAAATAVAKQPGHAFNPLYIYGKSGYGKTHLIQAVGNYIKQHHNALSVCYLTSERYTTEYVAAVQNNMVQTFKERYRRYDVLIIDDIQFFEGKEKTQEELFHLFNHLYQHNKQIVFSSDRHPNYIQNLEERLRTRFAQGMVVEILEPDYESRVAILKKKVTLAPIKIPDSVLSIIARKVPGSIRDLEGALNAVILYVQIKGVQPPPSELETILKDQHKPKRALSVQEVVQKVAEYYGIDPSLIYDKNRRKEAVLPRQVVMFLLRELLNMSYPTIGEKLGKRDHTTVIHSYDKIREGIGRDPTLRSQIEELRTLLTF
ncbi:MAG: chromosomal replication initiator protein DnaA [Candidatus Parcubacteria bacterium]|nr:MAG: chromosomal replication initiator protein DnaA [Candidatus Parcubacteria bacterium]